MGSYANEIEEMKTEGRIQQDCVKWFRNNFGLKIHAPQLVIFSVPNESSDLVETMKKKAIGLLSGAADTIIVFQDSVVFCEFKDGKGRQSPKQKDFQEKVEKLGHEYWLIRDQETFEEKVNEYLSR